MMGEITANKLTKTDELNCEMFNSALNSINSYEFCTKYSEQSE